MDIVLNFIQSFFGSAGLVIGVFALVGSILLRRTFLQTIESTFITVLGFLILSIGGGAISSSLEHFKAMFNILINGSSPQLGVSAVIAASDAFSVGLMNSSQQIASISAVMLLLAIVFNLLLAGLSRFKNIYLSTHIVMYFCVGITTMFMLCAPEGAMAFDQLGLLAAILGAGMIAIYTTLAPSLTTNTVEGLMHEKNMNLCHHGLFSFALANGIGRLVGKMKKGNYSSIENAHVPRWMRFLKNSNVTIVLVMTLLFVIVYVGAYCRSPVTATGVNGLNGISLPVALILDAFTFTAGLLVLIQGITMMVNELRDCIKGISQRFIRGAVMSVDASLILKTQPTAVMLGFVASFIGCIATMGISFALNAIDSMAFSSIVLPSVVVFFFLGGTAGIFGNFRGGVIGCLLAGFVVGLVVSFVPIIFNVTFNKLSVSGVQWYTDPRLGIIFHGQDVPAWLNNSYGESDYVIIAAIGWILYLGSAHGIDNCIGGILNPSTLALLIVTLAIWATLIIDGVVVNRKSKITHPQILYNYKFDRLYSLIVYYDRVHKDHVEYYSRLLKKTKNKAIKAKCKRKIAIVNSKHKIETKKVKAQIALLNNQYKSLVKVHHYEN